MAGVWEFASRGVLPQTLILVYQCYLTPSEKSSYKTTTATHYKESAANTPTSAYRLAV